MRASIRKITTGRRAHICNKSRASPITDSPLGPNGANLHYALVVLTDQAPGPSCSIQWRWKRYPPNKSLTNSSNSGTRPRKTIRLLGRVKMVSVKFFLCILTLGMDFFTRNSNKPSDSTSTLPHVSPIYLSFIFVKLFILVPFFS